MEKASRLRVRLMLVVPILLLVVAAVSGWFLIAPTRESETSSEKTSGNFEIVEIERQTLTVGESFSGRLGYGPPTPIPVRVSGTVTWLPKRGALAENGDKLMEVDGRPVVLMYGTSPAYRAMHAEQEAVRSKSAAQDGALSEQDRESSPAVLDEASIGDDVKQLEASLRSLGYTGFTVDVKFNSYTAEAVKRWQKDLGVDQTGRVEDGDVVFLSGPVRLYPDGAALGRAVTETSVQQSSTTKVVTVEVGDQGADWALAGERVEVTLPDQTSTKGRVLAASAGPTGEAEELGLTQQHVRIKLSRANAKRAEAGPVTVTHVSAVAKNVLAVPVTALVALAEGGYGVQVESGDYVTVTPGLYAEGLVEVEGPDLHEGARIRVPR